MTKYQQSGQVDLAILYALASSTNPISFDALYAHVNPHEQWVSVERVADVIKSLCSDSCAKFSWIDAPTRKDGYSITPKGRAKLVASWDEQPTRVTVCNHREPDEDSATALLCVDEDELNNWWDALDVEAKADAFVQWSLGNDGRNSHVYIEPRIPVGGTLGDVEDDDQDSEFIKKHLPAIVAAVRKGLSEQDALHARLDTVVHEQGGL